MCLLVFSSTIFYGDSLILMRFLRKRSQQNPALLFFNLLACWVPQQLHSYSLQLYAKGCHRIDQYATLHRKPARLHWGFSPSYVPTYLAFSTHTCLNEHSGLRQNRDSLNIFTQVGERKCDLVTWQSSRQKSIFHNDKN